MSSPTTPSILKLNRLLNPSVFNTGPAIPKVVPISLTALNDLARQSTPELSSPASSVSSLPSEPSSLASSRSSSPSKRTKSRRLPLESESIKQIFSQPLLVDLVCNETDSDDQQKMPIETRLFSSKSGLAQDFIHSHDAGIAGYETAGLHSHSSGYFLDACGNVFIYDPHCDPSNPLFNSQYAQAMMEESLEPLHTARPEDYIYQTIHAYPHLEYPCAPPPTAAFSTSDEFNALNLNPHATPFIPSFSAVAKEAPAIPKKTPLYPPGLLIPHKNRD